MTEKEYAKELIRLMEDGVICTCCPTAITAKSASGARGCRLCHSFIGSVYGPPRYQCPCQKFGKSKAVELTWIALEEKGYLEEV